MYIFAEIPITTMPVKTRDISPEDLIIVKGDQFTQYLDNMADGESREDMYDRSSSTSDDDSSDSFGSHAGSLKVHSDRIVNVLTQLAKDRNVLTEMSAVVGFLLQPVTVIMPRCPRDVRNTYTHSGGSAFTSLRILRDWCHVTTKKREAWCKTR